jgi:hypothetical protein
MHAACGLLPDWPAASYTTQNKIAMLEEAMELFAFKVRPFVAPITLRLDGHHNHLFFINRLLQALSESENN